MPALVRQIVLRLRHFLLAQPPRDFHRTRDSRDGSNTATRRLGSN